MFFKVQLFLCLVGLLALVACVLPGSGPVQLTAGDAGSTVHVKQGATVEVSLEGNPTTGYTWETVPDRSSLLAQQGQPVFAADNNALGSGGMMTLRFRAVQAGTAPLKLIYHRTFEPGVPPLHTFDVTIIVDP